jgi:diguanylate cyclase
MAVISVQQEIVQADLALEHVMNVVAGAAARLTNADAAVVELQEGEEMVYRAGSGRATDHIGLRLHAANSLSGLCVRLNETLRADDTEDDGRVDREACRRVGARSMLVTPLRHRDAALGVLKVYSSRAHAFDEASAEVLRMLVGIIAASMHRAREHEGLTRRALYDTLTGLANRELLEAKVAEKVRAGKPFALVFLDLNGFKKVNDECGHAAGDEVLQIVAQRILSSIRTFDIAARLGGDEFVVLLDGLDKRPIARSALQRILNHVNEPIAYAGETLSVSTSSGLALFPDDAPTADSLLRLADSRMYSEKRGTV